MTYAIDGEQYVAILAGWGGVWDIAPGIMAVEVRPPAQHQPAAGVQARRHRQAAARAAAARRWCSIRRAFTGTAAQVARGGALFGRYCGVCHGDAAVSGTLNPDLRHSPAIGSADAVQLGRDRRRAASTTAWSRSRRW